MRPLTPFDPAGRTRFVDPAGRARSALLVVIVALTVAVVVVLGGPTDAAGQEAVDTIEIVPVHTGHGLRLPVPARVLADSLVGGEGMGLVELRREGRAVAVVQLHQALLVANRSVRGERSYDILALDRAVEISADRMEVPGQHGPVTFWVGDELVGVLNTGAVAFVVERAARVR